MPIRFSKSASQGNLDLIERQIQGALTDNAMPPESLRRAAPSNLQASEGYRVYTLGLDELEKGDLLSTAKAANWRHLLLQGDDAIAEADLAETAGGEGRIVAFHGGPRAKGTLEGLKTADSLDDVRQAEYEPRVLEIPGIYFVALWLHGNGENDLVIPVEPDRSPLTNYRPYRLSEVTEALRERAREVRRQQEQNPGPSGA